MMVLKHSSLCCWLPVLLGLLLLGFVHCGCRFPTTNIDYGQYLYQSRRDARKVTAPDLYVLRFKCSSGYERIGPKFIQCVDGKWSDEVPTCKRMQCPDLPSIENADFEIRGGRSWSQFIGTVVTYSCDDGYKLSDPSSANLVCILDQATNKAVWTGNVPHCEEKKNCSDPGVSEHGEREGNCCFESDVLRFSCLENYELVGSEEIMCLSTGRWSSPRPLCRPFELHCELPPEIPHGIVIGEKDGDYFMPNSEAEILCEPGYYYNGSEFVICDENGEWEEEFDSCTEIFCDPPEPISNGTIYELLATNLTIFPYNFEITYGCDEGYRILGGDSWRFCGKNGWSGGTPYCEEIRCPDPGVPEHGERVGRNFRIGAKVRFRCFSGYSLLGSIERYCMPNGQWTGELARCDLPDNYCPNPGTPINGFKNSTSYDSGAVVGFRCRHGYILRGSEARVCLPNRTWSGTETKCKHPYDFDNSAQISDILKSKVADKFAEDAEEWKRYEAFRATVPMGKMLDLNYQGRLILHFAFDVSGSVGRYNFQRSIEFAKAIVRKVGISEDGARASALIFSSKAETKFMPMNDEVLTTEGVIIELDKIEYLGGGTSATSALAMIKENIGLEDTVFDKKNKKDVVFFITDGKANMDGTPEVEAKELKKGGVEIFCIGITGDPRIDTLYKIASKSKYGNEERENVFVLENYATLSYLIQEITNGTIDYSQCGLGMENVITQNRGRINGGESSAEPWPWMAALFFLPQGAKSLNEAELKCGGSVVHRNFILTAAHCMYFGDKQKKVLRLRDEREIIVKLGLKNVTNETMVQDFGVKRIHLHEKYRPGNYSSQLYDYDIALLELDRPIEYSNYIRPVCLPPKELKEDSPLYTPNEFGWVTGWGHQKVVNPEARNVRFTISKNLKELRLPIQSNERCTRSLEENKMKKKYFTDRMFCAGDGKTGNDTCQGDSGGPLMQPQMNSDGYIYWTQVGIVSWGLGCGWENTYGYYTHVQSLTRWIHQKINAQNDDYDYDE